MHPVELNLALEPGGKGPLYRQVADRIIESILSGCLKPGGRLPGIRELAKSLTVHPNTVLAAMRELEAQGWVRSLPRSGFFISDPLPTIAVKGAREASPAAEPGFEFPENLASITSTQNITMDLSDGVADARCAPAEALVKAYHRALNLKGTELLSAGDFKGHHRLREVLAAHLAAQRGMILKPGQILVLRSTSMAISLVAQTLLGPRGGNVAVENPGNRMVWETLQQVSAATLHPLPVDREGVRPEALEALLGQGSLQLLVLSPQCHYPTGVQLAAGRRSRILELSRQHRFPILELDPEFDYLPGPGSPPRPLASGNQGQVFYAGSLSRLLAPGVRVSFLAVPEHLADPMAKVRQRMDWQGDPMLEWALSELFLDGEILRHLRKVRKAVQERRDALEDALRHSLGEVVDFEPAAGGMALWLRGIHAFADPDAFDGWLRACRFKGLKLRPGNYFDLGQRELAATRLGFTAFTPEELQKAVSIMAL
ncbi:MAG TPA: PLP-dependent aminotransferase family protein [Holophaga sp.]|nr:PLP-dependent aminotransferase family protein [Holophaga sp.]HPS67915.1 PLP-dependent aminotransferase family protein [Holophaga sp.]